MSPFKGPPRRRWRRPRPSRSLTPEAPATRTKEARPMDDLLIPARDDPGDVFKQVASAFDAPAFMRRAQRVREAYEAVVERCRRQRDEWLAMVRTRLGTLAALAGSWDALRPLLADAEQARALADLHAALAPRLRAPVAPTTSPRVLRGA